MNGSLMEKTLTFRWPIWCSVACFWRFRTLAYFNFWDGLYIVSPIKLQRKRTFEKLSTCKWTTNSLISKCFEFELWPLKRSIALQLYGTDDYKSLYSLSHKVEISEQSKNTKNAQLSINVLIWMSTFLHEVLIHQFFLHLLNLNFDLWI